MNRQIQFIAIIISLSVLVSVSTFALLNKANTQTIVSFDVKSTVDAYHQSIIQKDMNLEVQTQRLTKFVSIMNEEVSRYQVENNAVVLVSAAIVGNSTTDITPIIQQAIINRYQTSEATK